MKVLLAAVSALLGLGLAATAHAEGVKVGTLVCNEGSGWGLVLGSNREMHCTFTAADQADKNERYDGSITKVGVDLGYKKAGVIIWAVVAPNQMNAGALAGNYVGVSANATAGAGVGANVLVGGFNNSIALQPVSIEGNEGLNVAAGVSGLTLKAH